MTVCSSTIANGLRVVSHRMEAVETISIGVWAHAGTRHERAEVNGIAHDVRTCGAHQCNYSQK